MSEKREWFENEDFWITYAPIMFDDNRWAEAPAVAEYVKKIAGIEQGSTVLDAGCGVGRISVEMAALGLDVTGVDIIQAELDAAKESAEDEGVKLKLLNADLRSLKTDRKFDCAVNLYTSFGYCDTKEEDTMILHSIYGALREGGTFIMECTSRETAVMYFTEGEVFDRAGFTVKTHFEVVGAWEGLLSHWDLFPIGNGAGAPGSQTGAGRTANAHATPVYSHEFVQRLYPASELRDRLLGIGFREAKVYGDFDFSPYDQHARTMVIVARK